MSRFEKKASIAFVDLHVCRQSSSEIAEQCAWTDLDGGIAWENYGFIE